MMSIGKHDGPARELWGNAYDDIPKAVFAVVAYSLAARDGIASVSFGQQVEALTRGGIIDQAQSRRVFKALAKIGA